MQGVVSVGSWKVDKGRAFKQEGGMQVGGKEEVYGYLVWQRMGGGPGNSRPQAPKNLETALLGSLLCSEAKTCLEKSSV